MQEFEGKVAVITGAASGIGRALTEKCIAEGMHVVMADIEEAILTEVSAKLQATTNNKVLPVVTNVALESELRNVLKEALDKLPINTEPQLLDARHVTHMDSTSCQLFYAYGQHLTVHDTTLVFLSPSDKFMAVVKALGFETDFNYASM